MNFDDTGRQDSEIPSERTPASDGTSGEGTPTGATSGGANAAPGATPGTTPGAAPGWMPAAPPAGSPWGDQQWGAPRPWNADSGWQPQSGWGAPIPQSFGPKRQSRLPAVITVVAACFFAFSAGLVVDRVGFQKSNTGSATPIVSAGSSLSTDQASALYLEAENVIKQNWVGRSSLTDQQLVDGSIAGLVASLGDTGHSEFLTAQEYSAFQSSLNASVAGIGVILSDDNGVYKISRVIKGTPADSAGVEAGDIITAVNGSSTAQMSFTDMAAQIRGTAGTSVSLTVIHLGSSQPVTFSIVRAQFSVPLADWGMVPGTHTADISLAEFSTGAADEVAKDITAAKSAGATSIILDLRGNPGGYASEAQEVSSEFLTGGTVYIEQDANGKNTNEPVDTKRAHTDMPLVVLVDHDSASSAEITAGALQDASRAKIVGVNTFGTGTVLQPFKLSDGSVIILGTSWWLTPNGHRIFGVGITPDQKVLMPGIAQPTDPTTLDTTTVSQFQSSTDAQLLAAVADLNP
jgi:carboxyl-terminal processing protease